MAKYSEELFINAVSNSVSFSATNTSLSAYCRFTYDRGFFTKYNVGEGSVRDGNPEIDDDMEQVQAVSGQFPYSRFSSTKPSKKLWKGLISL